MLSATSTQSPLATASSVFTMPTISMPTVSMANTAGLGGLADHLFMPQIPTDPPTAHSHPVSDTLDKNGEFKVKVITTDPTTAHSHPVSDTLDKNGEFKVKVITKNQQLLIVILCQMLSIKVVSLKSRSRP